MSDPNKPASPSTEPESEQPSESDTVSPPSPNDPPDEQPPGATSRSSEEAPEAEDPEAPPTASEQSVEEVSEAESDTDHPDETEEPEDPPTPDSEDSGVAPPPAESGGKKPPVKPRRPSLLDDDPESELGGRMTFLEHLDEFRRRILRSVISVILTFGVAWIFREQIYSFLAMPIHQVVDKLVVIKPTEPFTIYLKVSFTAAIFLAAPYILSQVWLFIAPGLYRKEKIYALPFLFSSTLLFVLGGVFAYYVILPPALNFLLLEFGAEFQPMISAVEFYDFELLIIIGMGVIFQLPILVAFLSIFGLVTPGFLWRNFRYAFLIITIIAAVVSPTTDPFNLFLWSGPMVILYGISIGISWIFQVRRKRAEKRAS